MLLFNLNGTLNASVPHSSTSSLSLSIRSSSLHSLLPFLYPSSLPFFSTLLVPMLLFNLKGTLNASVPHSSTSSPSLSNRSPSPQAHLPILDPPTLPFCHLGECGRGLV